MALTDKLSAIGTAIREKTGKTDLMTLDQMPAEILAIQSGGGGEVEPVVLTGNCNYACAGSLGGLYTEKFGNTITTQNVTSSSYMFHESSAEVIPFEINMNNSSYGDMTYMFNKTQVRKLPKINNAYPSAITYFLYGAEHLKEIPEDMFETWNWSRLHTYASAGMLRCLAYCLSLRKIPKSFLSNLWGIQTSASYNPYTNNIQNMYALDEIQGIAIQQAALTSNIMSGFCNNLFRASEVTFETNEDGTAKTANWKSQIFDLSKYTGYVSLDTYITSYTEYSGIGVDTKVTNDATYQALKNHPDWWTTNVNYSRYNHDSAVNTINSLPDCSATGTNTIKFKGTSGASTDGGAINTLTEAEIAVAAAKGWTVTLA